MVGQKHLAHDCGPTPLHDYAEADILRLSMFFHEHPSPILVCSPDGSVIRTNPAARRALKKLHLKEIDLLPTDHPQIVQQCLTGSLAEPTLTLTIGQIQMALTYHAIPTFNLVCLYFSQIHSVSLPSEPHTPDLLLQVEQTIHQIQALIYWEHLNQRVVFPTG